MYVSGIPVTHWQTTGSVTQGRSLTRHCRDDIQSGEASCITGSHLSRAEIITFRLNSYLVHIASRDDVRQRRLHTLQLLRRKALKILYQNKQTKQTDHTRSEQTKKKQKNPNLQFVFFVFLCVHLNSQIMYWLAHVVFNFAYVLLLFSLIHRR